MAIGRPRIFNDPKRCKKLLESLREGMSRRDACILAGAGLRTLQEELARNKDLKEQVEFAETKGKAELVKLVRKGAREDPKHAEWLLERKWPEEYARKSRDTVTIGQVSAAINAITRRLLPLIPQESHVAALDVVETIIEELSIQAGVVPKNASGG